MKDIAINKPGKRLLSLALAVVLALGTLPQTVFAVGESGGGTITAFEPLENSVANRTVSLGTTLKKLNLPATLTATVEVETSAEQTDSDSGSVQDSGTPAQENAAETNTDLQDDGTGGEDSVSGNNASGSDADEQQNSTPSDAQPSDDGASLRVQSVTGSAITLGESGVQGDADNTGTSQSTVPVPVTWAAEPDYDGDTAGIYTFTAEIEGFSLADGVQPPQITVTVGEAQGGVITAFAELNEDIRFQRGQEVILPETLEATVGGETAAVPVTWESETDENQKGLHVFEATPGVGYSLAEGVKNPVLSFYRTAGASMVMARMAGSGNAGDELEITTAAQLAEVAALTNAGKLEEMVFGTSEDVQVHLKLMNNIDISGQGDKDGWVPIGNFGNFFKGSFDGGDNTITGLTISRNADYQGLFGWISEGRVSGLGLVNVNIIGGGHIGGVAGVVNGAVENCFVTGKVSGALSVGGVVGAVNPDSTVKNCYSTANINGSSDIGRVGGVAGTVYGILENCYSIGSVTGKEYVGGVAGMFGGNPTIENCAALNPSVTGSSAGRVAGFNAGSLTGNYAFSGMTVNGNTVTDGDAKNGTGKTAADINADGTLFGLFADDDIWETADGALPGLFGETVEMPAHLIDSANPFAGGDGNSAATAYRITTAAQLAKLAELVNAGNTSYNSAYYQLMNNLDLSGIDPGGDKSGWAPIGKDYTNSFKGTFDGGGHTITGLTIKRTESDYQGLFGYMDGGTVSGVGLVNVSVNGNSYVGGVAGTGYYATVTNCYSTGSVNGNSYVGGVVGQVHNGTISSCYSVSKVSSTGTYVGGVAGYVHYATVTNCYSTGSVSGSNYVGGVTGYTGDNTTIKNCAALNSDVTATGGSNAGRIAGVYGNYTYFIDSIIAFSGMGGSVAGAGDSSANGFGKTAAELQTADGFPGTMTANNGLWQYEVGALPGLFGETVDMPVHLLSDGNPFSDGDGSEDEPYQITTAAQLAKLAQLVNAGNASYNSAYYKLMNNLDLTGIDPKGDKTGWVPIGTYDDQFKGGFDGGGHTITGLTINRTDGEDQGLFGYIGTGGAVNGLGLVKVSISGMEYVGGVAGTVEDGGTVKNCYSIGSVSASGGTVGGIGGSVDGTIENCYSNGSVNGNDYVGGIGGSVGGKIENCYSNGSVNGNDYVGGIGGSVNGTVEYCYSTGKVIGNDYVGGVAGSVDGKTERSVALNPSITATGGSNVARRVAGRVNYGTLTGNRAFNGMTGGGNAKTHDDLDGADMTATDAITPDFWTTAANWNTSGWDTAVWDVQPDKLPILRTVGGVQSGESGLYLTPKNAGNLTVTVNGGPHIYTGSAIEPSVTVKFGNTTLDEDTDYTLAFSNHTNVGTATVTVTAKGNYSGTKTASFSIDATVPGAPTNATAVAGNGSATVSFDAPVNNGGSAITGYTVTANPGGLTATEAASPITVNGLTNDTEYTFTVTARNAAGTGAASAESNAVTPFVPTVSVTGVSVSSTSYSLTVGGTVQLTATVSPGNATNQAVSWGSGATAVASVSSSGLVTAHAAGTAVITVTTADGGKTAQCTVTVTRTGSSSDNDSDSSSTPTVTIPAAVQPNQPTVGSVSGKVAGTNTQRTFTVTDSMVKAALEKAQAEAKKQGRTAYGVGAQIALDTPAAAGLTLTLERAALNRLVSEKAKQFELTGAPISLTFDTQALSEIQKQSTGNVIITVKPVTVDGVRNAYDITLTTVKDGKTVSITSLGTGSATLSISSTPGKNEAAGYLYAVYVDGNGKLNRIADSTYDTNCGSVIFSTNHFSVYGVGYTAPSAKFTDIGSHWAKESIDYVVGRGLLSGTAETTFAPDTAMTRGMLVTALGRLAGVDTKAYTTNSFTDVKADSTFRPYIEWAYSKDIVQGIGNSQFAPDRAITRQEIAVIFSNFAKAAGYTLPVTRTATTFADASSIGSTYKSAVTAMQQAGIMMGEQNNRFNPAANATRAEVSAMLHRYIKLTIDPATAQGWAKNDDGQFLYYKEGKAVTGTQTIDSVKYYFNTDGTLKTGWVKDDSGNWHFYSGNILLVGWWDIGANGNNKRYYFDTYGNMISGKWLQIDGKWYYFYADGSLAISTKVDGYEVDENGVRKTK